MDAMISVIVPVYKVEPYLRRCVASLLSQTRGNYEIILVDDESPDSCGAVCDELAEEYGIVSALHIPHGGLSAARNAGTAAARGEYVSYVDADDAVASDYLEYLCSLLESSGADISCCRWTRFSENAPECTGGEEPPETVTGAEACRRTIIDVERGDYPSACAKLIKRETALKYPFPYGKKHEDEATTYKFYLESDKVVFGSAEKYAYYINPAGIMAGAIAKKMSADALEAFETRADFIIERGCEELAVPAADMYIRCCLRNSAFFDGCSDDEITAGMRKYKAWLSAKVRVWAMIYKVSPALYRKLYARSSPNDPVLRSK